MMATKAKRPKKRKPTLTVIYEGLGNIQILKDGSGYIYVQFAIEDDKLSDLYDPDAGKKKT